MEIFFENFTAVIRLVFTLSKLLDKMEENLILSIFKKNPPLIIKLLTDEMKQHFDSATHCKISYINFDKKDRLKCKNIYHCHYTTIYMFLRKIAV